MNHEQQHQAKADAERPVERVVMRPAWIVVNIGCIECGVSSNVVGVFTDEAEAHRIAGEFNDKFDWREGGQNHYLVFPMPEPNVIHEEYVERE